MHQELSDRTGTKKAARKNKRAAARLTAASDAAGEPDVALTPFDYERDVDSATNAKIIILAANVVAKEARVRTTSFLLSSPC